MHTPRYTARRYWRAAEKKRFWHVGSDGARHEDNIVMLLLMSPTPQPRRQNKHERQRRHARNTMFFISSHIAYSNVVVRAHAIDSRLSSPPNRRHAAPAAARCREAHGAC
jgi:hypothetical protein